MSELEEDVRIAFENESLDFEKMTEPLHMFKEWFDFASKKEINDPNAMAIATADLSGMPNVRMVLLKEFNSRGFVFYTNSESQKGNELAVNQKASAVFHWKSIRRQIRIRGNVEIIDGQIADEYFASRPRISKIGAWASKQSRPLKDRTEFKKAIIKEIARFGVGSIPRPPYWNGYIIRPLYIEFWTNGEFRLHDRVIFSRGSVDEGWITERFYP